MGYVVSVKRIRTDRRLARLCVDEVRNVVYAMAVDEENGYRLVNISLK